MPLLAKFYDNIEEEWSTIYIKNILFGSKKITVTMNEGNGYSDKSLTPKEFYNKIKLKDKLVSKTPTPADFFSN